MTLNDPEELFHVKFWFACRCEIFGALLTDKLAKRRGLPLPLPDIPLAVCLNLQ